jgi:hypothetical protein
MTPPVPAPAALVEVRGDEGVALVAPLVDLVDDVDEIANEPRGPARARE